MSTQKIRDKYGSAERYAKLRGWNPNTLRRLLCGKMKGYGKLGQEMVNQMKKDRVF